MAGLLRVILSSTSFAIGFSLGDNRLSQGAGAGHPCEMELRIEVVGEIPPAKGEAKAMISLGDSRVARLENAILTLAAGIHSDRQDA